jgi:hypothetical protein
MAFKPGNQEAKKADHKKPRIITQKLIARLNDAEGAQLDRVIAALIGKAQEGDVAAIKEVFDRVDGKVPQAVIGGDDDDAPVNVLHRIERVIIDPKNRDG